MVYDDRSMPLTGHLDELRSRLIRSLLAIFIVFLPAYFFANVLFDFLAQPLHHITTDPHSLIGTSPTEAFFTENQGRFYCRALWRQSGYFLSTLAVRCSGPLPARTSLRLAVCHILFIFFRAGGRLLLYRRPADCVCVFSGRVPQHRGTGNLKDQRVSDLHGQNAARPLGLHLNCPGFAFFFARVGLITHHTLIGAFRYAAVGVFILAAILTPPDAISQMLLAAPLLLLYVLSYRGSLRVWEKGRGK